MTSQGLDVDLDVDLDGRVDFNLGQERDSVTASPVILTGVKELDPDDVA